MGYFGRLEDKIKAQELRRQGLSYQEILKTIHVSKDTLSRWCKDIPLTEEQKTRLINNRHLGQHKGSLKAAENKRKSRVERINKIKIQAKKELGQLKNRDRFIAGIALYAGEGNKADHGEIIFTNADPKLISFMAQWLIEFTEIPINKFRGAIWIHEGSSEMDAKKFWSDTSGIPLSQFRKTYISKPKDGSKKVRKNIHQYGIFSIRLSNSEAHRKIMGWIYALFDDKITPVR
ncbi:MAG TPA: hypothetical protein VG917_02380 [Patescibacteria group bacterium]|nr:hypothetical protein [Patescibacteria group bacterium]